MIKLKKIIEGGLESTNDSVKQLARTVSPDALVKQALGQQQKNEFTEYLKTVGKDLTPQEMEEKKKEFAEKDEKEKEEAQKIISAAIPPHMRPAKKPPAPRPYEATIRQEEEKKAQQMEAAKKQPQPLITPASKQSRGMLGAVRKKGQKGFEGLQKDTKVG